MPRATNRLLTLLLLPLSFVAGSALAFTPEEIAAAAAHVGPLAPIVAELADDALAGRDNESDGSLAAQELLIGWLSKVAEPLDDALPGDDAYRQPFLSFRGEGTNLLGVIRGGALPDEYVVVGAHYDHLGSSCTSVAPGNTICNGATDNAAGVAAVIGIARAIDALPTPPRRSVVLALWDAEEDGFVGSLHYVENDEIAPLSATVAHLNLDIQGANLSPSLRATSYAVGAETGGAELGALVESAIGAEALETQRLSFAFGGGQSDDINFVERGVPAVFLSDFVSACYHTSGDELTIVDFAKLREQTRIGFRLALELAETTTPPVFDAYFDSPRASFEDALALSKVFADLQDDLALFAPDQQAELLDARANVESVIDAGPDAFDSGSARTLIRAERAMSAALTSLPCDPAIVPEPAATLAGASALASLLALGRRRRR